MCLIPTKIVISFLASFSALLTTDTTFGQIAESFVFKAQIATKLAKKASFIENLRTKQITKTREETLRPESCEGA